MAVSSSCLRSAWLGLSSPLVSKTPRVSFSTGRTLCCKASTGSEEPKVYSQHSFYKGKSALTFHPGKPEFKTSKDGGYYLSKEGSMFLEFAPATAPRQYDWTRKQVLALSVVEMGSLIALTMSESIEFFHDPHLGSSAAGMIRKNLKVEPMSDKNGFLFNFSIANKQDNMDMRLSVPITKGEFAVIRSSFNYMIPYLMGWHALANPSNIRSFVNNQLDPDLEWSK